MDFLQVLVLSVVEGLTEFLPVSSTGHLILTSYLLKIAQGEFVKSFEIVIQLGAIFAVVSLYFKRLIIPSRLWLVILAAFVPTGVLGFVFYDFIKARLLDNELVVVGALFVGGILLLFVDRLQKAGGTLNLEAISFRQAVGIGFAQSLSMVPGVSRAAATIVGGLFLGLDRKTATEFSFLLAIPTMVAATGLDLVRTEFSFSQREYLFLGLGLVGSFVTAILAVRFLVSYVQRNNFVAFGVYRIVVAILFYFLFLR